VPGYFSRAKGETQNSTSCSLSTSNGDRKQLFPSVAKTVEKFMRRGESFELMKANAGLVLAAQAKSAPVYVKTDRADT
jgi:hypothetical protein